MGRRRRFGKSIGSNLHQVAHSYRLPSQRNPKLKWSYVDLKVKLIHLPDSKSGKKTIYLGQAAVDEFRRTIRVNNTPFVITGYIDGQHLIDMQKPWGRLRKDADLDDVRTHDLRHTFASHGIAMGQGLPIIWKLLGHSQPQTTARYAHLDSDPAIKVAIRFPSAW